MTTKEKGDAGEDAAADWLKAQGYHIVKRNLRTPAGEVDIVVYRDAILAFVEVKSWRTSTAADLEKSIHAGKRRNIIASARHFLRENPEWNAVQPRFDIVFLDSERNLRHFAGAFTESGFL